MITVDGETREPFIAKGVVAFPFTAEAAAAAAPRVPPASAVSVAFLVAVCTMRALR